MSKKKEIKKVTKAPIKKAVKKVAKKEVKKAESKKEVISAKAIGNKLIIIIDKVKHSKNFETKFDMEPIKNKILLFNKTNNPNLKKEIINLVNKTIETKEKKEAEKKGLKKLIKKEEKKVGKKKEEKPKEEIDFIKELSDKSEKIGLTEGEVKQLEDLIKANKMTIASEPKPQAPASQQKRGEY